MWALLLAACGGKCGDVPEGREPPEGYAALCETDEDCVEGMVCKEGAAGGFDHFYDLTCTPTCETDEDCPVVPGECADGPYCNLVSCGADGHCTEETCV